MGPFDEQILQEMIQKGSLKIDTLVWRAGMTNWTKVSEIPEVNKLFQSMPPKN